MYRDVFNVLYKKTMPCKQAVQSRERKIAYMLVVDSVEFNSFNQVFHIRHFDDGKPLFFKKYPQPLDKAVKIGNMGEHIVSVDNIRHLPSVSQVPGQFD